MSWKETVLMQGDIPAWLRAVKGVPLPGLQLATADADLALPPRVRFNGTAYPNVDGAHLMYLITVELPTGTRYPRWTQVVGNIRLHDTFGFEPYMDRIMAAAPGFQLLGPELSEHYIDWSESEQSAYESFYNYTPQLHALMQKLMDFARRLAGSDPGTEIVEVWEYVDPADYYELYLLFTNANCVRNQVRSDRDRDLQAHERWWFHQEHQAHGIDTPFGIQVRATAKRHITIIADVRDAKPSFP